MESGMIAKGNWDTFLTLNGEELLLVRRKHPFVVLFPLFLTSFIALCLILLVFFIFTQLLQSFSLFIASSLLIISFALSIITKNIIDWYFHLYVLTTRKIVEVSYNPLSKRSMNDILLDNVNCTEIDLRTHGFIHEIIGMGDLVITFDRPTYQEEFVLRDMQDTNSLGIFLTRKLMDRPMQTHMHPIWFRSRER